MQVLIEGVIKNPVFRGLCDTCGSLVQADREEAKKDDKGYAAAVITTDPNVGEVMTADCPFCGRGMILYGSSTAKVPPMPSPEVLAKAKADSEAAKAAAKTAAKAAAHEEHSHAHKK